MITIYHNPRCSKSREALAMAEQVAVRSNQALNVVDYLKTPLTAVQLIDLQSRLGVPLRDMLRTNEEEYLSLNLAQADDEALLRALVTYPSLLQRPIVVYQQRALIARPPELLKDFLQPG